MIVCANVGAVESNVARFSDRIQARGFAFDCLIRLPLSLVRDGSLSLLKDVLGKSKFDEPLFDEGKSLLDCTLKAVASVEELSFPLMWIVVLERYNGRPELSLKVIVVGVSVCNFG